LSGEEELAEIDIELEVWDFDVPQLRDAHMVADAWNWCGKQVKQPPREELRSFYRMLADHRVSARTIYPQPSVRITGDQVEIDFTPFDEMAEYCFEELGFNYTGFPHLHGTNWLGIQEKFRGIFHGQDISTPAGEKIFGDYVRKTAAHLREKGWLHKTAVQFWDEPTHAVSITEKIRGICKTIKQADPDIRIMLTEPVNRERDLFGLIDIWCSTYVTGGIVEERIAAGDEIWSYHNHLLMVDFPSLNSRILGWSLWPGGLTGTLFWSLTFWGDEPLKTNLGYLSMRGSVLNGNGSFLYPSPDDPNHLLSSVRWELVREGFEDFEYLCVLRDAIESEEQQGRDDVVLAEAKRVLKDEVGSIIRFRDVEPGTRGFAAYRINGDPKELMNVRERVARAIITLKQ